jgi:cytochrome c6
MNLVIYFRVQLIVLTFILISPVQAKNLEEGQTIFKSNCNVCHIGGNNIIIPEKNLWKKSLEANGMDNIEAIIYQVTNGKNGMPAFGGRLNESEIEKVATYIIYEFGKE